jgi:hypothetical protein
MRAFFGIAAFTITAILVASQGVLVSQTPPMPEKGKGKFKDKGKQEYKERAAELKVDLTALSKGLVKNPRFLEAGSDPKLPAHYTLAADVKWGRCGTELETTEQGIAFLPAKDLNNDGERSGSVTQRVTGFNGGVGKWFRFTFRGLAESQFAVEKDALFMKVSYFGKNGMNPLDGVSQNLYAHVEDDRKQLERNGNGFKYGGSIWRTYTLDFRLPFAEIDTLDLCVGFKNGVSKAEAWSEFYVAEFQLVPIPAPEDTPKVVKTEKGPAPSLKSLISLGGRWYYDPEPGMKERPATLIVNAKNSTRLYYLDDRLSNPFAENMTSWLRKGQLDLKGNAVAEDRFIPDNLVLEFKDSKEMVVHTRNLPNHPTAFFPSRQTTPNPIQEGDHTYYIPLEPVRNSKAVAMDKTNSNKALPMGSIGFAINGVCFFNPFDAGQMEAVSIMDRCCGHPSPTNQYHYHKYPVCVKSPFADDGESHSPLIGFALDGFPIYGPYVGKGVMAKDVTENPLDDFNMRKDDERGWHYHVTPGKYPYIIGGFAGTPDPRNLRRGPPR